MAPHFPTPLWENGGRHCHLKAIGKPFIWQQNMASQTASAPDGSGTQGQATSSCRGAPALLTCLMVLSQPSLLLALPRMEATAFNRGWNQGGLSHSSLGPELGGQM